MAAQFRTFVLGTGICMIYMGLLSWMQMSDYKAMENDRYNAGVVAGMRIANEVALQSDETRAMMWWTGSSDLAGARARLCKNYNPKEKK